MEECDDLMALLIAVGDEVYEDRIGWNITDESYRDYDGINGEPTEFMWNIFPGFTTLQLCGKVNDLLSRLGETPETFTGRIIFCVDVQRHFL